MNLATTCDAVGARIANQLAKSIGPHKYQMWFDRTARLDYDPRHGRLDVTVPNQFVADWIGRHFTGDLHEAMRRELDEPATLGFVIEPRRFADPVANNPGPAQAPVNKTPVATPRAMSVTTHHQELTSVRALRHNLDDFVVGNGNELAFASAVSLTEHDDRDRNTPLVIHGGCGLGKTHLLQGVCRRLLERKPDARVLYTTGEAFTNQFVRAIRNNQIAAFRRRIRSLHLLAVDDVHFIAGKKATQQEFLHSFDAIDLAGARLILASDCHPKQIAAFNDALISRCMRGMVVQVHEPDTATRAKIVRQLAERRGIRLVDGVIDALAGRHRGSIRELEGSLAKLHAISDLARQHRPDPARDQQIGHTLLNRLLDTERAARPARAVTPARVIDCVCKRLHVTAEKIKGSSRHRHIVLARSLTVHLIRKLTTLSYPEIAAALGKSNHSTIITADQRIARQISENPAIHLPPQLEAIPLATLAHDLEQQVFSHS